MVRRRSQAAAHEHPVAELKAQPRFLDWSRRGTGTSGRNSAPSLVSVGGIVPHHWYQWEE
ncbi:unnamed protein product [Staurois parvus]|uniref:Uncharacterized protein n=1 Tax=Staurois parvus TaxID=386267 RepID=A0ABN9DN95_9NEOB|nr:unnamed protein product [Staurois parvus]